MRMSSLSVYMGGGALHILHSCVFRLKRGENMNSICHKDQMILVDIFSFNELVFKDTIVPAGAIDAEGGSNDGTYVTQFLLTHFISC
jgi:hypothetical protein